MNKKIKQELDAIPNYTYRHTVIRKVEILNISSLFLNMKG